MASLLDRFRKLVFKNNQKTNIDFNKAIYNYLGNSVVNSSENDDSYINKGYRYNSTIYSIVNLITKSATTIPFQVYEIQNANDLKRYKSLTNGDFNTTSLHNAKILQKKSLIELENTELHQLLERPNPAQSFNTFISEILAFGLLTGNRYIYGLGPDTGANQNKYKELYVLPSQVMQIESGGIMDPVKEYSLEYNGTYKIPAEQILHIKDFNPYYDGTGSHLYGMSPLKAGLRTMDSNNEALTTGLKYLQNQTARGVLMSDEGDLNEVQARQLKDKFKQQYQGSKNAGDVVITPKKLSWINFGLNASDLSLIDQYNATIKDLCNIYNVPVQLLNNTDSSTYNNQKEAKKALYQNAVIPQMVKIREELNRWLTPQYGNNLYIDFDFTVVPELQEEMDKVVGQMSQAWWLTPNEKRAAMSYGVDADNNQLDDYYVPANLLPIGLNDIPEQPVEQLNIDVNNLISKRELRPDVFTTEAEAVKRAKEIGCVGYHTHDEDGNTIYMPCKTHDDYISATGQDVKEKKELKQDSYNNYPQGATNNAKRMLDWREKYGRDVVKGGTKVGWERANQLANRENLSVETIKRTYSFLARHKDNAIIADKFRDEPWKDKGYVAYNLWGGANMFKWAKKISENE
tara:strand:- start:157 stop:2049 length:1893 start_codon:yes stop_codon:yes gene_type:complete